MIVEEKYQKTNFRRVFLAGNDFLINRSGYNDELGNFNCFFKIVTLLFDCSIIKLI